MSPTTRFLTILFLLGACHGAAAAHITDKLVVGMYAQPSAEGAPVQLLASGTPLEVVRREQGFAEVRLADESRGWVEDTYITEEKPAKVMLLETQARLRQMGLELAGLREKQTANGSSQPPADSGTPPSAREAQLRQALSKAEQRIAELQQQVAERPVVEDAQRRLDELRGQVRQALDVLAAAQGMQLTAVKPAAPGLISRYQSWIIGVITLLIGFGGGVAFIDYRIRKRYGGFRI